MSPTIINQAGPLPISTKVQWPSSNTVLVAVSGSAWAKAPSTPLAVRVTLNATVIGELQMYANQPSTHLTFPTGFFAVDKQQGEVTVTLNPSNDTITDANDHFRVTLIY
ncbi:hypothetical protein [Longimicrobium sp.]|uniref:hypothetical protein n=1 Tax=Longimicrobium sp. TaxID=2029185 RepID=UPI002E2EF231|nr:hypothetical protein [Longimicrobium sp.]HEX6037666.1 hypothetical protein [Longimicrobium sp.]